MKKLTVKKLNYRYRPDIPVFFKFFNQIIGHMKKIANLRLTCFCYCHVNFLFY